MTRVSFQRLAAVLALLLTNTATSQVAIDERPAQPGEWGFRPADESEPARNPPPFSWRPQEGAVAYTLQIARAESFDVIEYEATKLELNVHCPDRTLAPGRWYWRFRFENGDGEHSAWSAVRRFTLSPDAAECPFPGRDAVLARVPDAHPRLFLRPEDVPHLRERFAGPDAEAFAVLRARCDALLAATPETEEPAKYGKDMVRGSDPWRAVWWGNRTYTIRLLDSAATLGFAWTMTGDRRYGDEARRLLLEAATWDPRGSTGYRYNDEAGMPYAYHFARTYTFIHDLLSEQDRAGCRRIMRARGREMYAHLHPRHLWKPYSSHSNRAWHFLGEVAIAFMGEIPEATDWLWFALNVQACVYPVWSDSDGGWHEGMNYWSSYIGRYTWWADVMKSATGIDAYALPYFSRAGDYAMYMLPPGTRGGGFGDLNARVDSNRLVPLMTTLAAQAGNPYWQWYVDAHGGPAWGNDYVSLLRRARSTVEPRSPADLPTSRLFAGTGQAVMNSTLESADENVRIVFKSSPFGTQSHGYEAQNAFLLDAYGAPLLIRSGYRDSYGSDHHRNWMWQTKSVNSVLVNGQGQTPHSPRATGAITRFRTSSHVDSVEGEAASAYGGRLDRFTRGILFIKPDLIVIRDEIEALEPAKYQWLLHAPAPFDIDGDLVRVQHEKAACVARIRAATDLTITMTDRFDPPPRERIRLTEYHLTAETTSAAKTASFITVIRTHRVGDTEPKLGSFERAGAGHVLDVPWSGGRAVIEIAGEAIEVTLHDSEDRIIEAWSTH